VELNETALCEEIAHTALKLVMAPARMPSLLGAWQVLLLFVGFYAGCNCHTTGINFVNWDGQKSCVPVKYSTPSNESELLAAVRYSIDHKQQIKVVGGGLSFSGIQMVDEGVSGHMISLDKLNKILQVTKFNDYSLVEVQAGARVRDLCGQLELLNLSMPNLGATATQSIVGAATTGTHGTGVNYGCIATQIEGFKLIDAQGISHAVSSSRKLDKPLLDAGRVSLGALGIIHSITLKTVPLFKLKKTYLSYSLSQLFLDLPSLMDQYEQLQWSFTPYTDSATVIIREIVDINTPISPEGGCWSTVPGVSTANCTDVSYKALTDSEARYESREIYTEMEMFIPVDQTLNAVNDFIAFMNDPDVVAKHDPVNALSVMIRYVAADDINLSPMNGRNTSVISFVVVGSQTESANQDEFMLYAQGLESICEAKYQGRVHWGKVNYASASYLQKAYIGSDGVSALDVFNRVRSQLDSQGVFMNGYLRDRLIG
jgi:FAD/FMN-containing dehydrogenase